MTNTTNNCIETKQICLWVEDEITLLGSPLHKTFNVINYRDKQIPDSGIHYILATPKTTESIIKAIAWKIQKAGYIPEVYTTNQPLEILLDNSEVTAKELAIQIFEFAQPFDQWQEQQESQLLRLKQAVSVAQAAIAFLEDPEKSIELQSLQQRCGCSSWDWKKLVEKLETQFMLELERRGLKQKVDPDERLKLSLLALMQETDPIKRLRRRAEICSHFQISKGDVETAINALRIKTEQEKTEAYALDGLFDLEMEALSWLVPELLPRGETVLLAAPPKCGKTLLAIDAAFALATGEANFLGESTGSRKKVLLVCPDQSLRSTRQKLLKRGFRRDDKDWVRVIPKWTIDRLAALEEQLEDFRPDVVIIDSLRRISHGSPISENSSEYSDNIYTLQELISRYNASGILIHHENKNPDAMGVDKVRGNTSIVGAVWGVWQLGHIPKKDPNNSKKLIIDPSDPKRIFNLFARDTEGATFQVELNPENNSWERLEGEVQQEQSTYRERILKVLNLNSKGLTGREVIEMLGLSPEENKRSVYNALNRMVNASLINCRPSNKGRSNIYSVVVSHQSLCFETPPPPTESVGNDELTLESIDNKEFDLSHHLSHHPDNLSHHQGENNQVMNSQNDCYEKVSDVSHHEYSETRGGGGIPEVDDQVTELSESQSELPQEENLKGVNIPLKVGEKIRCYPTLRHAQNEWKVKATVIEVEAESGYFKGCTVEYYSRTEKGKVKVRIAGGCGNWILSPVKSH